MVLEIQVSIGLMAPLATQSMHSYKVITLQRGGAGERSCSIGCNPLEDHGGARGHHSRCADKVMSLCRIIGLERSAHSNTMLIACCAPDG